MSPKRNIFLLIIVALIAATAFQNCSQLNNLFGGKDKSAETASRRGGGDGYEGKVYVSNSKYSGCLDGSPVVAAINIREDGSTYLVRNNCATLASPLILDASQIGLTNYDQFYLLYQNKPFGLYDSSNPETPYISNFCRGTAAIQGSTNTYAVDLALWTFSSRYYVGGRVLWATLDQAGSVLSVDDTGELLHVVPSGVDPQPIVYTSLPEGDKDFVATMASPYQQTDLELTIHRAGQADEVRVIQGLRCYQ